MKGALVKVFDVWVRKIPWRRKWQPAPVSLPGKSHGQGSLAGYSPCKESDTTEVTEYTCNEKSPFLSAVSSVPKECDSMQ